jgi:hypothetical protein
MTDERFDQLLDSLRDEPVDSAVEAEAKARVGEKLTESARMNPVCARFRLDFAAYKEGTLLESRRLLVQDHLSRCVDCRRVLEGHTAANVVAMPAFRTGANRFAGWSRWAIAAGVAALSIYASRDYLDTAFAPGGARATVESVSGELRGGNGPLAVGAKLNEGDVIRTGAGSRAVLRLTDGSAVEVNQLASLAVRSQWSGQTLELQGGDVILQVAKQRRGRLRVRTRDSVASVKGTIFAVSTGLAGSLVAVAEGAVEVEQGSKQQLLKRGERAASSDALSGVPVAEAFSWSQESQRYLALIGDLAKIEQAVMTAPENTRREAKLIPFLPPQPVVYGAIPNVGMTLSHAIEDQLRQSATLRAWWESKAGQEFKRVLDAMNTVAPHLGSEVVFVRSGVKNGIPLALAEVRPGQRVALEQALARLGNNRGGYRVTDRLFAMTDSTANLDRIYPALGQGSSTPFAAEILRRYQRGAGWLLAFNAETAVPRDAEAAIAGVDGLRHVVFEQRSENGQGQNDATLTFNGTRRGVASWLAAPGASGAAEYISPESVFAVSGVTKNPRAAFDEFISAVGRLHPASLQSLREFETKTGIRVADDLAGSMGSDFAFSIEQPTIPIPGWILAMEVTRASTLEASIRRLVDAVNRESADPKLRLVLGQETANGRSWTTLKMPGQSATLTLHWTYDRGYLVMSTDRAVAARSLATRNGGFPLVRSAGFRQRLPVSSSVHQSAFVWMNTTEALQQLVGLLAPQMKEVLVRRNLLVVVNAGTDRIEAQSKSRLTSLILDLAAAGITSMPGSSGKSVKTKVLKEIAKTAQERSGGDEEDE